MSTILVLAPYVPHPPTHGGSMRSRVLLEALCADHEVHLVVPIGGPQPRLAAQALARALPLQVHEAPVPAEPRPDFARKLLSWARGRSELLQRRWGERAGPVIAGLAAKVRPDLLVADSTFVWPVVPRASAPLLLHLHNLESSVFARGDASQRSFAERLTRQFEARTIAAAEREAIQRAALTITVSEVDRDLALAMVASANVVSVPNSIDLARLPLLSPPPAGPLRLLFVGTLDYPPNHEAVVELVTQHVPELRRAFPGLVVRIVGRDDAGRLAEFAGVEGVEAVGPVDDLLPHYECSHAVYLPIRSGGGTRIKILEAWAYGRPVLSTGIGAEALAGKEGEHWRRFESPGQGVDVLREVVGGQGPLLVAAARVLVEARYSNAAAILRLREVVGGMVGRR